MAGGHYYRKPHCWWCAKSGRLRRIGDKHTCDSPDCLELSYLTRPRQCRSWSWSINADPGGYIDGRDPAEGGPSLPSAQLHVEGLWVDWLFHGHYL